MKLISRTASLGLCTAFLLLQACATKAVSDDDRDTSGSFDGFWRAQITKGPRVQYIQSWIANCSGSDFELGVRVKNGQAYLNGAGGETPVVTNIDRTGEFAFILPLEGKARSTGGGSGRTLDNGSTRLYLTGNLSENKLKGIYKIGVLQFAWQGCTDKVVYSKSG